MRFGDMLRRFEVVDQGDLAAKLGLAGVTFENGAAVKLFGVPVKVARKCEALVANLALEQPV